MSVVAALSIVIVAMVLPFVGAATLLIIFLFSVSAVDDVLCTFVEVDDAACVSVSLSASLTPVLTAWPPTGRSSTSRKGWVAFLVVLNCCCRHHRFDPSDDRCGSVVLGQHGLDCVIERLGDEDILLKGGEDIL